MDFQKYIYDPARFASDFVVRSPARSAKVFRHKTPHRTKRCESIPGRHSYWLNPRTKQQPTGLIAYPACGRAVLFESL